MTDFLMTEAGIRQLQARYADAVWRKDYTAFGDCFAEDAEWRIAGEVWQGRKACVDLLATFMDRFDRVRMTLQTPIIHIDNGVVTGRTDVIEHNILKDGQRNITIGNYYDRFVQEGGLWRFSWHYYQLYYLGPPDMSGQFYKIKDFGPPSAMPPLDEPPMPL